MITYLQTNTWIKLLSIICLFLLISCNSCRKDTENKTSISAPKNLTAYFDSLQHHGFYIPYHSDSTDREKVMHTVKLLQDYQTGKRKFYPAKEVQTALELMRNELGYINSHRGDDLTAEDNGFFFRFLEQAARLCPDLYLLADVTSADHKVGVINFQEWSINPLYSFLLYENGKGGWNVTPIDTVGNVKIEKIFKLDKNGQSYYLLSNNFLSITFTQFIFMNENGIVSLFQGKQYEEALKTWYENRPEDCTITFNPQKVCWNFCHEVGEYYQQIENTKTLYLKLDKKQSYFYVE